MPGHYGGLVCQVWIRCDGAVGQVAGHLPTQPGSTLCRASNHDAIGSCLCHYLCSLFGCSDISIGDYRYIYRCFDLCDGFVFGFSAAASLNIPPVATGGRYDALTTVLGAGKGVPAVGGVIRPDLVAIAEAAQ